MVVANTSPIFVESVKADTQDISVTAEVGDEWYVSIPIIATHQYVENKYKTYEATNYETSTIEFGGTLSYDKRIALDQFTTVTWQDANGIKDDIETLAYQGSWSAAGAGMNLPSSWITGEVVETGSSSIMNFNSTAKRMMFQVAGLTAGDWNGSVHLNISLKDAAMFLNKDTVQYFTDDLDATSLELRQTIIKDGTEYEILGFNPDILTAMPNLESITFTPNSENTLWVIPSTVNTLTNARILSIDCGGMDVKGSVAKYISYAPQIWLDNYSNLYLGSSGNFFFESDGSDLDLSRIKSGIGEYTNTMRDGVRERVNDVSHYDEFILDNSYSCVPIPSNSNSFPSVDRLVIDNSYITQAGSNGTLYTDAPLSFHNIQTLESDETFVHQWTFNSIDTLTTVELGPNVKAIGSYAFYKCSGLTEVNIPVGTEYIGKYAFAGCTSLTDINIPYTVKFIEEGAFDNTPWLANIRAAGELYKTDGGIVIYDPGLMLSIDANGVCTVPRLVTRVTADMIPDGCTKLQFSEGSLCTSVDLSGVTLESLDLTNLTKVTNVVAKTNSHIGEQGYATNITGVTDEIRLNQKTIDLASGQLSVFTNSLNLPCRDAKLILEEGVMTLTPYSMNHYSNYPDSTFNIPSTVTKFASTRYYNEDVDYYFTQHVGYNMGSGEFQGFTVADGNPRYSAEDGVLYDDIDHLLVSVPNGYPETTFTVKDGTVNMGELSFSRNTHIKKLVLPDSYEFHSHLSDIAPHAPNAAQNSIHAATYIYNNINEYEVSNSNPNYTTIDGCLYDKDVTTLLAVPMDYTGGLTIPEGVTTIADNAIGFIGTAMWDTARTPVCSGVERWYIYSNVGDISLPSTLRTVPDDFIDFLNTGRYAGNGGGTVTAPLGCSVRQMLTGDGVKWVCCDDGSDPDSWRVQSIGKRTVNKSAGDHLGELTDSAGSVLINMLQQSPEIGHNYNIPVDNPYGISDVVFDAYKVNLFTTECWNYAIYGNTGLSGAFTLPGTEDAPYIYLTITIYDSGGNMITMTEEIAQYIIEHIE